jgi:uracil-DNA glycosylase
MNPSSCIACKEFPCTDVDKGCYTIPNTDLDPDAIAMIMISEAAPKDPGDYYYAKGDPLFQRTTVQAFNDAGVEAKTITDLVERGVYLTTAVKCGKTGYGIKAAPIRECSQILERELALFSGVRSLMLMGDVAIKALNYISKRNTGERVIPPGSTYKIRGADYSHGDIAVYPSYLQAGPAFFIEKSKRRMIAEDIRSAWERIG